MKAKEIKTMIAEQNPDALFLDGLDGDKEAFNEALVGIGNRCGLTGIAIYDYHKIIEILMKKYRMDDESAIEWYEYNMVGSYNGEHTPLFVEDFRIL